MKVPVEKHFYDNAPFFHGACQAIQLDVFV